MLGPGLQCHPLWSKRNVVGERPTCGSPNCRERWGRIPGSLACPASKPNTLDLQATSPVGLVEMDASEIDHDVELTYNYHCMSMLLTPASAIFCLCSYVCEAVGGAEAEVLGDIAAGGLPGAS